MYLSLTLSFSFFFLIFLVANCDIRVSQSRLYNFVSRQSLIEKRHAESDKRNFAIAEQELSCRAAIAVDRTAVIFFFLFLPPPLFFYDAFLFYWEAFFFSSFILFSLQTLLSLSLSIWHFLNITMEDCL